MNFTVWAVWAGQGSKGKFICPTFEGVLFYYFHSQKERVAFINQLYIELELLLPEVIYELLSALHRGFQHFGQKTVS